MHLASHSSNQICDLQGFVYLCTVALYKLSRRLHTTCSHHTEKPHVDMACLNTCTVWRCMDFGAEPRVNSFLLQLFNHDRRGGLKRHRRELTRIGSNKDDRINKVEFLERRGANVRAAISPHFVRTSDFFSFENLPHAPRIQRKQISKLKEDYGVVGEAETKRAHRKTITTHKMKQ